MFGLIGTGLCVYLWVAYAQSFAFALGAVAPAPYALALYDLGKAIFAGLLLLLLLLVSCIGKLLTIGRGSDGIRNSAIVRRTVGFLAEAALLAGLTVFFVSMTRAVTGPHVLTDLSAFLCAFGSMRQSKIFIGRATRPVRLLFRSRYFGMGGTAQFSGMLDEWANPWTPGTILLGRSLYNPRWLVGIEDDRHITTIATSRAGKGRSAIIPNLLTWPGSALVIDPKGQNAFVTARARGHGGVGMTGALGQTVRIVDPLGAIDDPGLHNLIARFNPLAEIDPASDDYAERIAAIADALVVTNPNGKDAFFDNSARDLIAGLIDYAKRSPQVGEDERTLVTVRGLLVHPDGPPLDEMAQMGGLAQAGAAGLLIGGQNATGDVKYTAMTHTAWLESAGMQRTLAASDFSLADLNNGKTTIYLVLPPMDIDLHGRFLRLFVSLALRAAMKGRKGKHATLFLLDEFYALGRLQQLAKSAGAMAGYGVKLWPIIQNIGQVQELYPQNWETFLGNAGLWTAFAMNDETTKKYLSERLGKRLLWRKMRGPNGFEWEISGAANLRDALELSKMTCRESSKLAVFTESGDTFLLGRAPYDQIFKNDRYSADPFEAQARGFHTIIEQFQDAMDRQLLRFRKQPAQARTTPRPALTYQPRERFVASWWKARRKQTKRSQNKGQTR
jgi:type IV secretory pathway TraG/TraD family ATPase VirD4